MDLSKSVVDGINSYFHRWLQDHPLIWWVIGNPGWSLLILFVLMALFVGLLGAIGRSIEHFWLWLLRKPLFLFQPLLDWLWQRVKQGSLSSLRQSPAQRVDFLLSRLSQIQQEQEQVLQELTQIVKVARK